MFKRFLHTYNSPSLTSQIIMPQQRAFYCKKAASCLLHDQAYPRRSWLVALIHHHEAATLPSTCLSCRSHVEALANDGLLHLH